jgi:hypothetical protein
VSRSVSLPERLWPLVDTYAKSLGGERSSWIASLVIPALRSAGKLDASTPSRAQARLDELLRAFPEDQVLNKLEELATAASEAAATARV